MAFQSLRCPDYAFHATTSAQVGRDTSENKGANRQLSSQYRMTSPLSDLPSVDHNTRSRPASGNMSNESDVNSSSVRTQAQYRSDVLASCQSPESICRNSAYRHTLFSDISNVNLDFVLPKSEILLLRHHIDEVCHIQLISEYRRY